MVSVSKVMWGALQKHPPLVDVETLIPGIPGISARSPWALQGFGWWVGSWWGLGRSGSLWDRWISKASWAERVWGLVKSKPKIPCFRWGCLTNSANHLKIAEMYLHFPSFSYIPFFRAAINWGDAPFRDKPAVFTAESARKVGFDVATLHCEEPQEPRRVAVSNFGYGSKLPKNSVMNIAQYQCDLMWYVFLLPDCTPGSHHQHDTKVSCGFELLWKHCLLFPPNTTKGFWVPVLVKQLRIIDSW